MGVIGQQHFLGTLARQRLRGMRQGDLGQRKQLLNAYLHADFGKGLLHGAVDARIGVKQRAVKIE